MTARYPPDVRSRTESSSTSPLCTSRTRTAYWTVVRTSHPGGNAITSRRPPGAPRVTRQTLGAPAARAAAMALASLTGEVGWAAARLAGALEGLVSAEITVVPGTRA